MARGASQVATAAGELAGEVSVEAVSDMKQGQRQFQASVHVLREVDESLGELLDTLA